jgi:hypothetical protein
VRAVLKFPRLLATVAGAMLAALLPAEAASGPNLQIAMSVVSISVPASAYDPATAQAVVTVASGIVAQVNTNKRWSLQMRATNANFVFTPLSGPTAVKPVSDLQLRDSGTGALFTPTLSFTTIDTGGDTRGKWVNSPFDLLFQASAADDPAGKYSVILEFQVI